jgi:hypothetical protein
MTLTPPPPSDAYGPSVWVHKISSILPGPSDPLMQHGLSLNNARAATKTTQYRLVRRHGATQDAFIPGLDSIKISCSAVNILLRATIALSHRYEVMKHGYVRVVTQSISTTPYSVSSHALGGLTSGLERHQACGDVLQANAKTGSTTLIFTRLIRQSAHCSMNSAGPAISHQSITGLSRLRCSALDIILPTRRLLSEYQHQAKIFRLLERKITLIHKTSRRKDLISDPAGMEERKRRQ